MKIRLSLLLILTVAFCGGLSAQSVVITGKNVTYTRKNSISDYKKTFTINYPKIKASTPALSKKIEASISYSSVLHLDLKEELSDTQWLEEADYEVGYNKNGILSIALSMVGSAAYPDGTTKHVVVDLKTGKRVTASDLFTNVTGLHALVLKAKNKEVAQAVADLRKDPEFNEQDPNDLFKDSTQHTPLKLDDFSIAADGVTFYYDYGFPHVIQALQPAGEFKFSWKQLKPYIKPGGLLGQFVR